MSRTYKDRPWKVRSKENQWGWSVDRDYDKFYTFYNMQLPTTRTKKRKEVDTEDNWMTTPMWWIRERMNRPQRREGRIWESNVLKAVDLEEVDKPSISRKPHLYYW